MRASMNLRGRWHILKGRLKQKLARALHSQQRYSEGREEELMGRLRRHTHMSRQEIRRFMRHL